MSHGFATLTIINHGFSSKTVVIQMVIKMPKTWLLHVYYNKTMLHFHKGFSNYISTTLVKETEYYVMNICSVSDIHLLFLWVIFLI